MNRTNTLINSWKQHSEKLRMLNSYPFVEKNFTKALTILMNNGSNPELGEFFKSNTLYGFKIVMENENKWKFVNGRLSVDVELKFENYKDFGSFRELVSAEIHIEK